MLKRRLQTSEGETDRGIKNIVSGLTGQMLVIAAGLVVPRLILQKLGEEVNGLLSSVNGLFAWLVLLEAGVGISARRALYKPVAEKNYAAINAILSAGCRLYRRAGILSGAVIAVTAVTYGMLLKSSMPVGMVMGMVLLAGAPYVFSCILQGSYRVFLEAEGKNYILEGLQSLRTIGNAVGRISLLYMGLGILPVQTATLMVSVIQTVLLISYMRRQYPWLDLRAAPDLSAVSYHHDVLIHQITGLLFGNTDLLLLTWLCDLSTVSVYSVYAMFYTMLNNILYTVSNSFLYLLGKRLQEDKERFLRVYDFYESGYMLVSSAALCIMEVMLLPFMGLYIGRLEGIAAEAYLDAGLPLLFTVMNLLAHGRVPASLIIELYGHFQETKGRAILEIVINLVVSMAGIRLYGIYGVLLGTIAALLYRGIDMIWYAGGLLGRSPWITLRRWGRNGLLVIVVVQGMKWLMPPIESVGAFCMWGCVTAGVTIGGFGAVYVVMERKTKKSLFHKIGK